MFAALFSPAAADLPSLMAAARAFSPRIEEQLGGRLVLIDAAGLGRIVGDAGTIARELRHALAAADAAASGRIGVSVAPTRTAALLLAVGRDGTTVVPPGTTAAAVGALGLEVFDALARIDGAKKRPCALCLLCLGAHRRARRLCGQPGGACTELPTLRRWGLATLGTFAALPASELASRLGQPGVALQQLARGLDSRPLVPVVEAQRFEASLDLEWPIERLQPLSFVLMRLLEPLAVALERADCGAAAIVTELTLVKLSTEAAACHLRRLELPAPMRDARVLRTLVLLDLETHPPGAAVDRIAVRIEPTRGRIVQFSLLERAGAQPEAIATLVARLTAIAGEGRVGSPALVDSHEPGAFELRGFALEAGGQPPSQDLPPGTPEAGGERPPAAVLRRFRLPVPARVTVDRGRPVRVTTDRTGITGGRVDRCSGPWRSSGGWWRDRQPWNRDEFDVALDDGGVYRIYRDRTDDRWMVEGMLD
jgi:protein ImuB